MVIGPTPPGTGVTAPATSRIAAKSTSPMSRAPSRLVPTSMTVAPGLTNSGPTGPGLPAATIRMSAHRERPGRSGVHERASVTLASHLLRPSMIANGRPTRHERPITTTFAPEVSMP